MKLEDLKDDAERINYLLHALNYTTSCECCLHMGMHDMDAPITCPYPSEERDLMRADGTLCPHVDFNDVRPV